MYSISFAILEGAVATRLWLRDRISERGATAVEYGLLVGLIAVVIAAVVLTLGTGLHGLFGTTSNCITNANTAGSTGGTIPATACP